MQRRRSLQHGYYYSRIEIRNPDKPPRRILRGGFLLDYPWRVGVIWEICAILVLMEIALNLEKEVEYVEKEMDGY